MALALVLLQLWLHWSRFSSQRLWFALAITAAFALLAWAARGVTRSGALAGAAASFILTAQEPKLFLVLLTVFLLTLGATKLGKLRKQELHAAEGPRGRSAAQVTSNLGLAMLVIALGLANELLLSIAVMAEVAADTCSSEFGMAFPGKTVLITTGKAVPAGINGGISLRGTAAALVAAAVVSGAGMLLHLMTIHQAVIAMAAGFAGMLVDSLLGALVEARGYLNNDAVNLLSTASAAALAWIFS